MKNCSCFLFLHIVSLLGICYFRISKKYRFLSQRLFDQWDVEAYLIIFVLINTSKQFSKLFAFKGNESHDFVFGCNAWTKMMNFYVIVVSINSRLSFNSKCKNRSRFWKFWNNEIIFKVSVGWFFTKMLTDNKWVSLIEIKANFFDVYKFFELAFWSFNFWTNVQVISFNLHVSKTSIPIDMKLDGILTAFLAWKGNCGVTKIKLNFN